MTDASLVPPGARRMVGGFALARILWWLALLTIVGGVARIAATYPVLSATFDEPAHIAAGMQLLDRGDFTYEPLHPPLARVAAALGPWFAGYRAQNSGDLWIEGQRMFYGRDGRPDTGVVTLARFGILPFFVAAVGLVWLWTEYTFGAVEGALAAIALGNLPVMLAHAGLATTDAAFAMTFVAAFFAFLWWLERRSLPRGLALGAAVGFALCTKLLALLFLPAACGAVLVHRWFCDGRDWPVRALLLSGHRLVPPLAACLLTVWVVFGCRADPLYGVLSLADGVRQLLAFAGTGEPSYFLGEIAVHGSWAFFPVLILVKSPLPFLIAVAIGAAVLLRRDRRDWRRMAPLIGALAIIASVMPSPINIGLRHVLPALPLLAIVAAVGLGRLLEVPVAAHRAALAWVLVAWQTGEAAAAAPDYLPYFNQLALGQPQRIVTGSDLDWGQDVRRLAETLHERRVEGLHLALHTSNDAQVYGVPLFEILYPGQPAVGWIAISEQMRAYYCAGYRWLDAYRPVAQVGASIRLYHVPGPPAAPSRPAAAQRFDWRVPQPCATASPGR